MRVTAGPHVQSFVCLNAFAKSCIVGRVKHTALNAVNFDRMKKAVFIFLCIVALALAGYFLLDQGYIWFVYPDKTSYPVRGIDLSNHNGEVDWDRVRETDVSFVFLKATEGDDFKDRRFEKNWQEAIDAGFVVGAYHYYSLRYGGEVQARNFIATVPVREGVLPPVIDLEYGGNSVARPSKEELQHELNTYISAVASHFGQKPILYVTRDFYMDYLYPEFSEYPLWVRDLFREPSSDGLEKWTFWQYKNRGHVKGIEGFVDQNVFRGTEKDLGQIIKKSE